MVSGHSNAVQRYLRTGDADDLDRFKGVTVAGGVDLETDLDDLDVMGRLGDLDFDDFYENTT